MTAYEGIKGSAVVTAGTAASNDLLARTSFMDINGAGTLRLVEQRARLRARREADGLDRHPNCETLDEFVGGELPFDIRGTVTAPDDHAGLQQARPAAASRGDPGAAGDRIEDRLRDILR